MKKELRDRWTAALRSGKYKQSQNVLHDDQGFCCLGVACHIFAEEIGIRVTPNEGDNEDLTTYDGLYDVLPERLQTYMGLSSDGEFEKPIHATSENTFLADKARTLVELNDEFGYTFDQIADVIEEQF